MKNMKYLTIKIYKHIYLNYKFIKNKKKSKQR